MTNEGEVLAGSTVDSHMMKNTEWGACAILSQSKYGIFNSQSSIEEPTDGTKRRIWNNPNGYNSGKYIYTGYVGNSADASTTYSSTVAPTNVIEYNKKNTSGLDGPKASTTGTVYGVYDMAGGSWEYVAGVLKGNSTDSSKDLEYATSKFNITNLCLFVSPSIPTWSVITTVARIQVVLLLPATVVVVTAASVSVWC